MACENNNGCTERLAKKILISYNNLKELLSYLSGKICLAVGGIKVTSTPPLHLEKTTDDEGILINGYVDEASQDEEGNYTSGVMSASDKEKLDSIPENIPIYNIIDGNGLTVDDENVSMGLASEDGNGAMSSDDKAKLDTLQTYDVATEEADGLMSAEDKAKLDTLQTYDVATEEADGLMSKEDKATIDTLTSEYRLELSRNPIVFTNSTNVVTFTLTAYQGLEKVDISSLVTTLTDSKGRHDTMTAGYNTNDGVATIIVERLRSCLDADGELNIIVNRDVNRQQIPIGSITVPIYSVDHNNAVLQGWINPVYEEDRMRAQLWTFDGSDPSVRFVRDGAYWLNLPTEWSNLLGEFDIEKMIVQVTIGGSAAGTDVFCGRFYPGGEWNGDVASTDCWAAVLMLVSNKSGESVNNSFYISVYYVPEVNTYYAENEKEPEWTITYETPDVYVTYDSVSQSNTSVMPELSYGQNWEKSGPGTLPQSGTTIVGGDVGYQLIENLAPTYFNVTVDETTGKVTIATAEGVWAGHSMDVATVRASVTMNGLTGYCDATIKYEI